MGLVHRGKISSGHRVRARDLRLAGQLAKPAARRRGRAHFLHEIPSVQRAAPRRGVLQHALARGLRFWQTTLSFLKVPRTVASPHPSILPNTDLIKATLSSFAKVPYQRTCAPAD